jgi:hypothetical protein
VLGGGGMQEVGIRIGGRRVNGRRRRVEMARGVICEGRH